MPTHTLKQTVPSDEQLRDEEYRAELKTDVRTQGLSERDWPTAIQDMFLRAHLRGMLFQYAPVRFEIPEVDQVWGDERYIRRFLRDDHCRHPAKDRLIAIYRDYRMGRFSR
ncbi:MAG: hypothetical protein AAGE83_08440 [Pseudomonadota bacterium]